MLLQNATSKQLEQAAAVNHRELFRLNALSGDGDIQERNGLTWIYEGKDRNAMIPFPSLSGEQAGPLLDEMMAWFRKHPPGKAGCWSLAPPQPADLGIKLLARGFQPGWQPNWMALDLDTIKTDHPLPEGLQVIPDNDTSTDDVQELPYGGSNGAISSELLKTYPDKAQRFIAILNGEIVAHSAVLFSTGEYGTAGLYNVGVIPSARLKGIGKAVVIAACQLAKEKGYRYATLNGTGRRMYEQVGFNHVSNGLTWWLMTKQYITDPPPAKLVTFIEAVGNGDITEMEHLLKSLTTDDLNKPITNGMTLMQLAIHCRRPGAAEWLAEHGSAHTVLDLWDIDWKDRAKALLEANPALVNQRYDYLQYTLLHIAAERNDIALAQLVLPFKPDLTLEDAIYHGTPLNWAHHFNRKEMAELIQAVSE
jgi:predicted N-acetyltransferase YhbS